jgi:hypothetical protein
LTSYIPFSTAAANVTQAISPPAVKSPNLNPGTAVAGETYQQDGDFIKDIEINDLRNRYTLTKGATQKKVTSFASTDSPRALPLSLLPGRLATQRRVRCGPGVDISVGHLIGESELTDF